MTVKKSILFMFFIELFIPICAVSQTEKQPNVLLIVIEYYTGFLGGHPQVKTAHMDALEKEGVVYSNAMNKVIQ